MKHTVNFVRYCFYFILNLLMLLFLHGYFNLLILICMVVLPIVSAIVAWQVSKHVEISFAGPKENMHVGDVCFLRIQVHNHTIFPIVNGVIHVKVSNGFAGVSGEHTLNIPIYGKGTAEVTYPIENQNLGIIKLEADALVITDWLGLFSFHKKVESFTELVLLPFSSLEVEPDLSAVESGMTELEESKKKGSDFSEVQEVREYQPGDKLQNIHWKLSAKKDALMVKERVSLSSSQMLMLVELYQDESMIINDILSAAYGAATFFVKNQIPLTIKWWSIRENDIKSMSIDNIGDLNTWIEYVYYEALYQDAGLGAEMLSVILGEQGRFLAVGSKDSHKGDILFAYKEVVEGCILS